MKVGTRSLLFGVHQVLWHPYTVLRAWIHLYGWPNWRELVCIFIHDWGYWGLDEMDGRDGLWHPAKAADIAYRWLGHEYHRLCLYHSRHLAAEMGAKPSKLCWADKYSMLYDPQWFYLGRARLSGEIHEYRLNAHNRGFCGLSEPDAIWHEKLIRHHASLAQLHTSQ